MVLDQQLLCEFPKRDLLVFRELKRSRMPRIKPPKAPRLFADGTFQPPRGGMESWAGLCAQTSLGECTAATGSLRRMRPEPGRGIVLDYTADARNSPRNTLITLEPP